MATVKDQVYEIAQKRLDRGHNPYDTHTFVGVSKQYVDGIYGWVAHFVVAYPNGRNNILWLGRNLSEVKEWAREWDARAREF